MIRREAYQRIKQAFKAASIRFTHRQDTVFMPPGTTASVESAAAGAGAPRRRPRPERSVPPDAPGGSECLWGLLEPAVSDTWKRNDSKETRTVSDEHLVRTARARTITAILIACLALPSVAQEKTPDYNNRIPKLSISANAPAKDFWSVVLYDPQMRSELQTGNPFPGKTNKRDGLSLSSGEALVSAPRSVERRPGVVLSGGDSGVLAANSRGPFPHGV